MVSSWAWCARREPTVARCVSPEITGAIRSPCLPHPRLSGPATSISARWFRTPRPGIHDRGAGDRPHDEVPGDLTLNIRPRPEAATNKLFRAAQFELPEPGRGNCRSEVEGLMARP